MAKANVEVTCLDCGFQESHAALGRARIALAGHASETGHDVDWTINRIAPGVERAGADAGVCGIDGCENTDSPLLNWDQTADES